MSWNYRVCTYLFSYKETFPNNENFKKKKDERIFSINSVYYKNGKPVSYGPSKDILDGWENLNDLKSTLNKIHEAMNKPIIDLDNFPKIYKKNEKIYNTKIKR